MTTAFQTVFDNATTISINKRKKVAQTVARDGTVKSTSLGGQLWQFEVSLPSGPRYSVYRPLIEAIEALDRTTVGEVQITQDYISGYLGSLTSLTGHSVTYTSGNTVEFTHGLSAGFAFRAGDILQLGVDGSVYSVVEDVPYTSTTVTLNRPVRQAPGNYDLLIGPNCVFEIICVNFPDWTIFGYDQVSWSGAFVFSEAI